MALTCAMIIFSCSKNDPCENTTCPEDYLGREDGDICTCVYVGTNPCNDVTCPDGYVAVANGTDCDCVDNPNEFEMITVSGQVENGTVWTKDNIYVLNGKAVVNDGATLIIEAGTIIKGSPGTGSLASALIVARGAKLIAEGTNLEPIIFTSLQDEITPGMIVSPNLDETFNGLWGGLIVLGGAPISAGDGDTEAQIEGIPADDLFGRFGGDNPIDNSGIFRYISVRHGGALIGSDNEINGITFGGVGSGTIVENIEVIANLDDGVEWFGGTVNITNVVVAYGEDDGLDIDMNYAGTITNAFIIQSGATAGDNAFEIDGPEGSTYTDGLFTINNVTIIDEDGNSDKAADFKSKSQGTINNASWRGFTDFLYIRHSCQDDCMTEKTDTYTNWVDGKFNITNSEIVSSVSINDVINVYGDKDCPDTDGDGEGEKCNIDPSQNTMIESIFFISNSINSTSTTGANATPFIGWSWAAVNGKI